MKIGQKVIVTDGNPHQEGVIENISSWGAVLDLEFGWDDEVCYFVCVPSWDNNTNGGRWLGASHVKEV